MQLELDGTKFLVTLNIKDASTGKLCTSTVMSVVTSAAISDMIAEVGSALKAKILNTHDLTK